MSTSIDLSVTFAPIYWGFVISVALGGISIVQGYMYFPNTNDRLSIQFFAGSMLVLDFTSSALVAQSVYYYLIPHFGSLLPLNSITPELSAECLISTIITLISQLYFAKQLNIVKKTAKGISPVPVIIGLLACLAFAFGVACTTAMVIHNYAVLGNRATTFQIFFGLAKGFGAVTDIVATIAMCKFLASSRTGMNQTNSLITSLIHFVIHRGALVTLIQTLLLIMFFAAPTRLYWLAFHINVTKLYVNTFFAMLNGRTHLHRKHTGVTVSPGSHLCVTREPHGASQTPQFRNSEVSCRDNECEIEDHDEGKVYPMTPMPTVTRTVLISDL